MNEPLSSARSMINDSVDSAVSSVVDVVLAESRESSTFDFGVGG